MEEVKPILSVIYFWGGIGLLAISVIIVFLVRHKPKTSAKLAFILTLILFSFKSVESLVWTFIDIGEVKLVEYSYFAYYLVPLLLLFGHPRTRYTAGFYAFAVGLGYAIGLCMNPGNMLATHKDLAFMYYSACRGVIQHMMLFLIGALSIFNVTRFKKTDFIPLFIIMAALTGWMYLVKFKIVYPEGYSGKSMGVIIADGSLASWVFGENIETWHRALFISIEVILAFGLLIGFIAINRAIFKRRFKKNKIPYLELPIEDDFGIYPAIIRSRNKKHQKKDWAI